MNNCQVTDNGQITKNKGQVSDVKQVINAGQVDIYHITHGGNLTNICKVKHIIGQQH